MIGVFDSGFGGLTVLKEFRRILPKYDYAYLGDNARAPYGNKSGRLIYKYSKEAVDFLFKKGCGLIIVACHTASTQALRRLQQEYLPKNFPDRRILGVVAPAVERIIDFDRHSRVGIIGTLATIKSRAYKKELRKIRKDLEVYEKACPMLVPLIEDGWVKKPETKMILKECLRPLKNKKIDTLILGCTHYPFLASEIKKEMGKKVAIINPAVAVAQKLKDYLMRHAEIESKLSKRGKRYFYTTDNQERFKKLGKKFLGSDIKLAKKIIL
jgi:glutamate racemase